MTAFFVPDTAPGEATSRAYERLRSYAEVTTGRTARGGRIFKLSCRSGGADCETAVGGGGLGAAETVQAIFDVGDAYAIVWCGGHEILAKRQTYLAIEFD